MLGFSFLFPAFLIGGLAVVVPIILHLLKREAAPKLSFSAVRFLKRAPVDHTRRQRLRELLLLALRVAALLLLALAFARPYLGGAAAGSSPVTLVLVDTSLSVSAPAQLEMARQLARDAVEGAPVGHRVGVVTFDDDVTVAVEPSVDRAASLAAIAALQPGFGGTRFAPALNRAGEMIGSRDGSVTIVTDLQRSGWDPATIGVLPEGVTIAVAAIDPVVGNLSVEDARDGGRETVVTLRHMGVAPTASRLTVALDDEVLAEVDAEWAADGLTDIAVPTVWPVQGNLSISVTDPEGLAGDDTRFWVTDPPAPTDVLVVGATGVPADDAFYLVSALTAAGAESRFAIAGTTGAEVADQTGSLDSAAAVVLASTRALDRAGWQALSSYVRAGGGLFIAFGPDVDPGVVTQILDVESALDIETSASTTTGVTFAPADVRHPIFRPFAALAANLGQVRFERTIRMRETPGADIRALARFSDGSAAYVERTMGSGRVLVLGSDTENAWNDFPLHPSFVPFVHETIRYLTQDRGASAAFVVGERPPGTSPEPGIVLDPRTGRSVAINVDARESALERMTEEELLGSIRRVDRVALAAQDSGNAELENQQAWWRYGLLLMLVALAAEGLVGARVKYAKGDVTK